MLDLTATLEENNEHDVFAVAWVHTDLGIVGHAPREISKVLHNFITHCGLKSLLY